ncbi:MAG: hypothetical protein SGI72_16565 [Planctomycetota bacterium]|nr:hypothetical protein [Planctomycetota bacterium]
MIGSTKLVFRGMATAFMLLVLAALVRADHKDARLGFTMQTPRGWTPLPMKVDEKWLVAAYQSDKPNFWTDKAGGWTNEHRPDCQVIAFVSEDVKAKAKVTKGQDKKGNESIFIEFDSPYKDYKDYMQRRYTGGGWFIDKEEQITVNDVKVTAYEIRVDKLSYNGPKRILTWIYHVSDVDIAVQFEMLTDAAPKVQPEIVRCLKSFKAIQRSGEALTNSVSTGRRMTLLDMDEVSPEERKNARISLEREAHDLATKKLTEGWTAKRMGRFYVLNHADEKLAKSIVEQAEAVWSWLDETFPFIGDKEYVRSPIIRICKDQNEYNAFNRTGGWSLNDLEIVTCQDYGGSTSWMVEVVKTRMLDIWFEDRDRDLYWAMPRWLKDGLSEVIKKLKVKGNKVVFGTNDWARDEVRQAIRDGTLTKPRELMTLSNDEFWKDFWKAQQASSTLVGFFVSGVAAKNPRTKTVLVDYVKALKSVQLAIRTEEKAKGDKDTTQPKTEEEEDAAFKNQRQGYKEKEKRILEETQRKAFSGWSDKDWDEFHDAYTKAIS